MGKFSSVGRGGKVLTEPRRLSSDSSAIVEDCLKEKESRLICFWMDLVEDKVGFSVELGHEYSCEVCER